MSTKNYNTLDYESQVKKILFKTQVKKQLNTSVVSWLRDENQILKALEVEQCANHIGITEINNVAHIVKADFCRNRICNICAWRRQSKFVAQMFPVLEKLGSKYEYLFATLTIKNVKYEDLSHAIDIILQGYDRLLKRRKIKRAWVGKIRGLEVTYNAKTKTFHPHIHIFIAVKKDYFTNADLYISQNEFTEYWQECIRADYKPICNVEKVTDAQGGAVETLKYSFKSSTDSTALKGYFYTLKNRRLVSFSGVFADMRKLLKQSDFENILTDDVETKNITRLAYSLYKFDATGGIYKYYDSLELSLKG
jgi:plasmid rolling circle replication initiator protein Rep